MHVIGLEPFGYVNVRPFLCPTTSFLEDANLLFCQFTVFFHTLFILLSWFLLLFQSASYIPLLPQGVALGCIPFGASPRLCASYLSTSSAYSCLVIYHQVNVVTPFLFHSSAYSCSLIYHQCVDRMICTYTERAIGVNLKIYIVGHIGFDMLLRNVYIHLRMIIFDDADVGF
ncbi:hypothetical protein HMPREF9019_1146 [Hoylesella timonensis CRIS 5C-B1]|uniref:Uncharacterized protein n=1 Tax=Hoylesella timonensis CRIS 5C-B1 TaxID=679189 RepID=D1VYA1_9BACT|nr:hypothetical protein HMPREF9019_1146 [Hoylesella timonensis CRIS 5C-B1]